VYSVQLKKFNVQHYLYDSYMGPVSKGFQVRDGLIQKVLIRPIASANGAL